MRNAAFWVTSSLLVIGALAATVATATVDWLYPSLITERSLTFSRRGPVTVGAEAALAAEMVRRAGAGSITAAAALTDGIAEEEIRRRVSEVEATPLRAAPLPGGKGGAVEVLLWARYRREGAWSRAAYRLTVEGGKVTKLTGPLVPEGGYQPLSVAALDEQGQPVDLRGERGQSLILVAPRRPTAQLGRTLSDLHADFRLYGIKVVLALDMAAPDWERQARAAGFEGPIWRVKAHLENLPVVNPGSFEGAVGVLVDREGYVVGSIAGLDPSRYGLQVPARDIAPTVLRAYGLLP